MSDTKQKRSDEEVLQFVLHAINKGKKFEKTKGTDLVSSGLWDAMMLFCPEIKNPLSQLQQFVENGQLYMRPNFKSFFVYDPGNISEQVRKKCILPSKVLSDHSHVSGVTQLIWEIFTFSKAGALCKNEMHFQIEESGAVFDDPKRTRVVISKYKSTGPTLSLVVYVEGESPAVYKCLLTVPPSVDRGEMQEALEHAKSFYDKVFRGSALFAFEMDRAKNLHAIAKGLLDGTTANTSSGIPVDVVNQLQKEIQKIQACGREVAKSKNFQNWKKQELQEAERKHEDATRELQETERQMKMAVEAAKEVVIEYPDLVSLLELVTE